MAYTALMGIWDKHFAARSPMFAPLRALGAALDCADWPALGQLNAIASANAVVSGGGQPLRFASLSGQPAPAAADYELRTHDEGVVLMRDANWHDFFNAATWLVFPRAKAAVNRAHVEALCVQRSAERTVRSRKRDALTLFDESGVLVLSHSRAVLAGIRDFAWKRVFWEERDSLLATTRFVMFGHALYEKALLPYVGMTGHAVLLEVPDNGDTPETSAGVAEADAAAAHALIERVTHPHDLSPLPVLGVPGWWDGNRSAAFYDNAAYFRAGRREKQSTQNQAGCGAAAG